MEDQIAKEWVNKNDNKWTNFLTRIGPGHIIVFGVIIFIIIAISKNQVTSNKYSILIYSVLVGIILVLMFKPNKEKKLLPEHVVKKIAQEALESKRREGVEIPQDSKVYVQPACHLKWNNDMQTGEYFPTAWEIGFIEKVHGSNYNRDGVISIHPFEGIVTGISWRPLGYTGLESRDKDIVPVFSVGNKPRPDDSNPK